MTTVVTANEYNNVNTQQKEINIEASKHIELDEAILAALPSGTNVVAVTPSGASAWAHSVCLETRLADGVKKLYFLKASSGHSASGGCDLARRMFEGSFESESLLHRYLPNYVPKPHAWGSYSSPQAPNTWYYLCDFHDLVDEVPALDQFVSVIASLHNDSLGKEQRYGFHVPTHLANIPNNNEWQDTWEAFFKQLMERMMQVEADAHPPDDEFEGLKQDFMAKVLPRLLRPLETGGRSIQPCLIHSNLWPGNCMLDADSDDVIVFDSCAYWGHNEADLGSWRAPRYRLGKPYIKQYQRTISISEPEADWDDRNALYAMRYDLLVSALYPGTSYGLKFREL
ncbi:uncharacterized protein KY384_005804 [Bacidia gigantensis]|uniref:uncharacterized protein n=1 Tax=Bacidia gigantensis TaxID=2732470 RepID=UPI001D04B9D1|nr:uncharacterized protein KY384_005804 [Bacidia gigantensis]KAG8529169.1 hypothetical protein KY384_005804 [Bacidia gigantensis]